MNVRRKLDIIKSNYGRDGGWLVEESGKLITALSDCQWSDMFWDDYAIDPVDDSHSEDAVMYDAYWEDPKNTQIRSRSFDDIVITTFISRYSDNRPRRLLVRALYIRVRLNLLEQLIAVFLDPRALRLYWKA